jgi:hypothetical protein
MNTVVSNFYRDVTCAAAAVLITLVLGVSFVQSTSAAPFHTQAPAATETQG